MKIAVEGCAHGELEKIYDSILNIEQQDNIKVDLLICCGDFQSTRNEADLQSMAIPQKFYNMCTFYKYYSGELTAPILTIFIGGNHEASNYLQELAFGGWVAPNIYYLGYAGIVNVAGVRIGGISGIYKGHDYMKGHFEHPPYDNSTKRSVYHVRNIEVFRLKQTKQPIDIFLSHDWPRGIYNHGNSQQLVKFKPFFAEEVRTNTLGSQPCEELLDFLKPAYWFSAHLHCKFAALVSHKVQTEGDEEKVTKFLALDKCLPRRRFLQILDFPHDETKPIELQYDVEWLSILFLTNHLTSVNKNIVYLPTVRDTCRSNYSPTAEESDLIRQKFHNDFVIPLNFAPTVAPYDPNMSKKEKKRSNHQTGPSINIQTSTFCERLGIDDPMVMALERTGTSFHSPHLNQTLRSFATPDRSGDTTQVSLASESFFVEEPLPVKRLSLVLPSPRNLDASDAFDDTRQDDEPMTRLSLALPTPVNVMAGEREEGDEVSEQADAEKCDVSPVPRTEDPVGACVESPRKEDEIPQITDQKDKEAKTESLAEVPVEPQVKKFKRRNQALYANTDDD